MQVVSVNVGLPREVVWKGITVETGIFKDPVDGPVMIEPLFKFFEPVVFFFRPGANFLARFYFLLVMLWTLVT